MYMYNMYNVYKLNTYKKYLLEFKREEQLINVLVLLLSFNCIHII